MKKLFYIVALLSMLNTYVQAQTTKMFYLKRQGPEQKYQRTCIEDSILWLKFKLSQAHNTVDSLTTEVLTITQKITAVEDSELECLHAVATLSEEDARTNTTNEDIARLQKTCDSLDRAVVKLCPLFDKTLTAYQKSLQVVCALEQKLKDRHHELFQFLLKRSKVRDFKKEEWKYIIFIIPERKRTKQYVFDFT